MNRAQVVLAILLVLNTGPLAHACGPDFPDGYVWQSTGERALRMPYFSFEEAVNDLAGYQGRQIDRVEKAPRVQWLATLVADREDLHAALEARGEKNARSLSEQYAEMREEMNQAFRKISRHRYRFEGAPATTLAQNPAGFAPPSFNFQPFAPLLDGSVSGLREIVVAKPAEFWLDTAEVEAEIGRFANALHAMNVSPETNLALVSRYRQLTRQLRYHTLATLHPHPADFPSDALSLHAYAGLFASIPEEFALYTLGAWEYRCGYYETAIERFAELLALPEAARKYRSTWAAYMLGEAWTHLDTARAVPFFEMTRALAAEGYPDTTGLAEASVAMQELSERYPDRYGFAMHHYLETIGAPEFDGRHQIYQALAQICDAAVEDSPFPKSFLQYPRFFEVLSQLALAHSSPFDSDAFLEAMKNTHLEASLPGLGRFACAAYRVGSFDKAEQWISLAAPDDPHALWVRAKLALRDGKTQDAARLFAQVDQLFVEQAVPQAETTYEHQQVLGDLAVVQLNAQAYPEALATFLRGDYRLDAAYVSDLVLTTSELAAYVKAHSGDESAETVVRLSYILARRYARKGQYDKAIPYYPKHTPNDVYPNYDIRGWPSLAEGLTHYRDLVALGRDKRRANRERAEALVSAATLAKDSGMHLFATEVPPDSRMLGGGFVVPSSVRPEGPMTSADERNRVARHSSPHPYRFTYRWIAADLMWEAARLLPDNDPLTAKTLWQGGKWIAPKDPKGADRFYKALVRRCRKLPIGQEADERRWFPPKPEDW